MPFPDPAGEKNKGQWPRKEGEEKKGKVLQQTMEDQIITESLIKVLLTVDCLRKYSIEMYFQQCLSMLEYETNIPEGLCTGIGSGIEPPSWCK